MVRNATLACRRVCKGLDVLDSIVLGGDRRGLTLVSPRADGSRSDFDNGERGARVSLLAPRARPARGTAEPERPPRGAENDLTQKQVPILP